MSETTTPAPAASPVALDSVSVPVPSAAVPPTTNTPAQPEAAPEPAKTAEPEKSADETTEQPRDEDGKFTKPKPTAKERQDRIRQDIDRLTAEKYATQRQVEALQAEAMRLSRQLQEQQSPDDPYDARHATRQAVREDRLEQTVEAARSAAVAVDTARAQMFQAKIEAARENIEGLDEGLASFARLPVSSPEMADLIAESDKAPELANYLGRNPQEFYRIARMPAHLQGAEIARLEMRVSTPPAARKTSNAPPPPPMINGSSAPASPSVAEMGVADLQKLIYAARA
jgi:ribosomal protein L12E/L44/L45/RPP1/RPP2